MPSNVDALIEAARHLTPEDRERVVKALLPPSRPSRQHRITEMRGLGMDLWQGLMLRSI